MRIIAWSSDVCSSDLGYLGDPSLGAVILDTFSRIRAANPQALWTCDPVMGNKGKGLFVRAGVPGFMAEGALPTADILTPNLFELELLTGLKPRGLQAVRDAAAPLLARGPKVVLGTSLDAAHHNAETSSEQRREGKEGDRTCKT